MSREIKFRAWDNVENKMIYLGEDNDYVFEIASYGIRSVKIGENPFDYEVLEHLKYLQFTGLKDKNSKGIYEGDIVACESNGVNRYESRVVCYDSNQAKFKAVPLPAYHLNAGNGGWTGYNLQWYCEVIGNIYENPELLVN